MSNNAEQYTVKTPEEIALNFSEQFQKNYPKRPLFKMMDDLCKEIKLYSSELIKENERLKGTIGVECVKQLLAAREENAKIKKFKEYVHCRLDAMGIPSDPEPDKNAEHGCRIEGRLNYIELKFQPKKDETPEI